MKFKRVRKFTGGVLGEMSEATNAVQKSLEKIRAVSPIRFIHENNSIAISARSEEKGTTEWSGRVLDLHGTVIFELDPEASPPVVIGNVYLLIDTTKEGEDAVSFSSSVGAIPRYITYEVGESDGAGGYTKKSGYVCGDIRVPLILGGDEFSVLTQTEGTGGIDMGYLRAIGGSVP